jgi:SAM-dependent methyltransferase
MWTPETAIALMAADTCSATVILVAVTTSWLVSIYEGRNDVPDIINPLAKYGADLMNFILPTEVIQFGGVAFEFVSTRFHGVWSEQGSYLGVPLVAMVAASFRNLTPPVPRGCNMNLTHKAALLVPAIRRLYDARNSLLAERDSLLAERDSLLAERDSLLLRTTFRGLVRDVYVGLLNREPDPQAMEFYTRAMEEDDFKLSDLCRSIANAGSNEFLATVLSKRELSVFKTREVARNSRFCELSQLPEYQAFDMSRSSLSPSDFEHICNRTLPKIDTPAYREYVSLHRKRFWETLSFVSAERNDKGNLLEISTSPYTWSIKQLYGGRIVTADHPSIYPGISDAPNPATNSDCHIAIDFNNEKISPRAKVAAQGAGFDLILFCEIIEHLLPSPFDLITDIADALRPGGKLFISTPNFFSFERSLKMLHREHPNPILRAGDSFAFGAQHVREYTMDELIEIVQAAGLKLRHFNFSDCWDQVSPWRDFVELHPGERACLMVVAERPDCE